MSQSVADSKSVGTAVKEKKPRRPELLLNEGYSSQEDDAPTRVYPGKATYSQVLDALPPLMQATTRERETEKDSHDEIRQLRPWYARDFGDKITPGLDDVLQQAGLRIDSGLTGIDNNSATVEESGVQVTTMDIMHNWTQEVHDGEFVATINILKKRSETSMGTEGRVVWVHVQDPTPSLERLETIFAARLAKHLQPFVRETTKSLLNKVRTLRERKLVSGNLGKFMLPGVIRYSARSSQTGNEDHPCLFHAFPYLALGRFSREPSHPCEKKNRHRSSMNFQRTGQAGQRAVRNGHLPNAERHKNDPESQNHASYQMNNISRNSTNRNVVNEDEDSEDTKLYHITRTLLQSRYQLESTKRRDRHQGIFTLTSKIVRECISRPTWTTHSESTANAGEPDNQPLSPQSYRFFSIPWLPRSTPKPKRDRLYIPQLWSISVSGDVMLTCGPISIEDLCGSALMRKDFEVGQSKLKHSLVRFIVEKGSQHDDVFLYPAESCEWFFGLINKQRKVESHLGTKSIGGSKSTSTTSQTLYYTIVYRKDTDDIGQEVDCNNWLQIQCDHTGSHLDLFLEDRHQSPDININGVPISPVRRSSIHRSNSHARSLSDSVIPVLPTSPRFLLTPQSEQNRGRSGSSSLRSLSPGIAATVGWPSNYSAFFEWKFLEEMTKTSSQNQRRTSSDRVGALLAKVHYALYRSYGRDMDRSLKPTLKATYLVGQAVRLDEPVQPCDYDNLKKKFFSRDGPPILKDNSTTLSREAQRIFGTAKILLELFVPRPYHNPSPEVQNGRMMIKLYWGLISRILGGIVDRKLTESELTLLSTTLRQFEETAKRIHRGVWKMADDKDDPLTVNVVDSGVIYMPIADAFQGLCILFLDVIVFMASVDVVPGPQNLSECVEDSTDSIRQAFAMAQRFYIQGGDENRYVRNLGPVVTPEGISILLLSRLCRSVYKDGTVNVIDLYERIVERLALNVKRSASRFLLLKINRVAEEIDIILSNFLEQRNFLEEYKDYLNPAIIENPTTKRKTRFEYEQSEIDHLIHQVNDHIKDCRELESQVKRLANQNIQLVEGGQDDISKKLMLFTVVTIVFQPLSFVAGFFGMNLKGIGDTTYSVDHFWLIAAPLTGGLLLLSLLVLYRTTILGMLKWIWTTTLADHLDDD